MNNTEKDLFLSLFIKNSLPDTINYYFDQSIDLLTDSELSVESLWNIMAYVMEYLKDRSDYL